MKVKISGFTLVEMAIVIVIISLLLTTVLGFANGLRQSSALSATITRQQTIKNALINFIATNNRLPCPSPSVPPTPTTVPGVEDTPGQAPATACPNSNPTNSNTAGVRVVSGLIPWISLGLTDEAGTDGYYNRFTYQVVQSATYTNLSSETVVGIKGDISVHEPTSLLPAPTLGPSPAGNQTNFCIPPGSTSTYNSCAAVAIIVSHGSNGTGGYSRFGSALPVPVGLDEQENTEDGNARFVMKESSNDNANPFDDIVLPLTPNDLLSPLTLNGSLQSVNALISNRFKNITATIVSVAIADHRTSGPGTPYVLSIPPAINDPWGNPIQVAFPPALGVPPSIINTTTGTVFTLSSAGADGNFGNDDDITTAVPVGQIFGPFNDAGW